MSSEPTNDNTAVPAENRLKQMIERELIRTAPVGEMPDEGPPRPPLFSQISHGQEVPEVVAPDSLEELPVDEDLGVKIQEFAERLASVKS
jgi:hypothetical protein